METFHKAVGLRMKAGVPGRENVQEGTQNTPDRGCEVCPMVKGSLDKNSKSGCPARDEGSGTAAAEMEDKGTASGQHDILSRMAKR